MSLTSAAATKKMARLHLVPVAGLAEPGEGALSSLNRLSQNVLNASLAPKHGGKRQSVFLRAARPILHHPSPESSLLQQKKREAPKTDDAGPYADEELLGVSSLRSLDSLVPHFAMDVQESEGDRELSSPSLAPLEASLTGGPPRGDAPGFWTLNWSSAVEAVENVISLAQGFNISFLPVAGDEETSPPKEDQPKQSRDQPKQSPSSCPRSAAILPLAVPPTQVSRLHPAGPGRSHPKGTPISNTLSSQRHEALRAELDALELMLRPKCPWPRQDTASSVMPSEELILPSVAPEKVIQHRPTLVGTEEVSGERIEVVAVGPRCSWPREVGKLRTTGVGPAVAAESVVGAHCSWPRVTKAASLMTLAASAPTAPLRSLQTDFVAAYPRCAWPRGDSEPEPVGASPTTAFTVESLSAGAALASLGQVALVAAAMANSPRCAWPREHKVAAASLDAVALVAMGPRCEWPRKTNAVASPASPLEIAAVTAPLAPAPRCAWPGAGAAPPAVLDLNLPQGPRCAWPKATAAAAVTLDPTPEIQPKGPRCTWPRPASGLPSLKIVREEARVLGPRCAWPKEAASPAALVSQKGFVEQESSSEKMLASLNPITAPLPPSGSRILNEELGASPRCAWPRVSTSSAPAVGPRCGWPRTAAGMGVAALQPTAAVLLAVADTAVANASAVVEPVGGPRCAWPRTAPAMTKAAGVALGATASAPSLQGTGTSDSAVDVVSLGPRCSWPRVGESPVKSAEAKAEGPRCVWPRLVQKSAVNSEDTKVELPQVMGPRCPWPRTVAPHKAVPAAPLGQEPVQMESSAEELEWEVLPSVVREAARNFPRVATRAHFGNAESAFPIFGPRCAWPRSRAGTPEYLV